MRKIINTLRLNTRKIRSDPDFLANIKTHT